MILHLTLLGAVPLSFFIRERRASMVEYRTCTGSEAPPNNLQLPLRLLAKPVLEPIYRRYITKVRAAGG